MSHIITAYILCALIVMKQSALFHHGKLSRTVGQMHTNNAYINCHLAIPCK